jgi:hypothetical protein
MSKTDIPFETLITNLYKTKMKCTESFDMGFYGIEKDVSITDRSCFLYNRIQPIAESLLAERPKVKRMISKQFCTVSSN